MVFERELYLVLVPFPSIFFVIERLKDEFVPLENQSEIQDRLGLSSMENNKERKNLYVFLLFCVCLSILFLSFPRFLRREEHKKRDDIDRVLFIRVHPWFCHYAKFLER